MERADVVFTNIDIDKTTEGVSVEEMIAERGILDDEVVEYVAYGFSLYGDGCISVCIGGNEGGDAYFCHVYSRKYRDGTNRVNFGFRL